jgi:hypothetical protein
MPRKGAGYKYPHITTAARVHDHTMCPVTSAIAEAARAGDEPWGTEHDMPIMAVDADKAIEIRRKLFTAKDCKRLAAVHGALSVSVTWRTPEGGLQNSPPVRLEGGYQLVVRVWAKSIAKAEIQRRVEAGEPLAYNVMRMDA